MAKVDIADDVELLRFRRHSGALRVLERIILIAVPCLAAVYLLNIPTYLGILLFFEQYLAAFLGLILVATFLIKPATPKSPLGKLPWYDVVLAVLSVVVCAYLVIFWPEIVLTVSTITLPRVVLATIAVILILEATRRYFGWALVGTILFFIFYALFTNLFPGPFYGRPLSFPRLMVNLYLDNGGLLGITLQVGATVVVAFILFARLLFAAGGGRWLINQALSAMGRFSGAPAKTAVVASGLFGTISGIAVANVVVTGSVTIPMMKKYGWPPEDAAAVEATASTGGILMPPIMGVVAFIMALYLGTSYTQVCIWAAVPALLYYFACFMQVHFLSARRRYTPLPPEEIPSFIQTLKEGWIFLIPVAVLMYTMFILWLDASTCGIYTSISVILVTLFKKETRLTFRKLAAALETCTEGILEIAMVCAAAGLVVGPILFTGLGSSFAQSLTLMAGGHLFPLLLLTAVASIIMGMGMSIVTIYVILVILVAPALIQIGVSPPAAHLFVIYFGMASFLTPPVCMSVYAACGIAHSGVWRTGWRAIRLGIVAYLIPFFFVYEPALLLIGSPIAIVIHVTTAFIGAFILSAGFEGYLFQNMGWVKRVLFIIAGLGLFMPFYTGEIIGVALSIVLVLVEWLLKRRTSLRLGQRKIVPPLSPDDE